MPRKVSGIILQRDTFLHAQNIALLKVIKRHIRDRWISFTEDSPVFSALGSRPSFPTD